MNCPKGCFSWSRLAQAGSLLLAVTKTRSDCHKMMMRIKNYRMTASQMAAKKKMSARGALAAFLSVLGNVFTFQHIVSELFTCDKIPVDGRSQWTAAQHTAHWRPLPGWNCCEWSCLLWMWQTECYFQTTYQVFHLILQMFSIKFHISTFQSFSVAGVRTCLWYMEILQLS